MKQDKKTIADEILSSYKEYEYRPLEYVKDFNKKVEEAFNMSDEEVEALREPLFERFDGKDNTNKFVVDFFEGEGAYDKLISEGFEFTTAFSLEAMLWKLKIKKLQLYIRLELQKKKDTKEMKEIYESILKKIPKENR